ncbi:MAG: peptidylprolyl isomerase [Lachnospiraceae bacterium]|nr:peptidylprolyl isomerase [Lachnospiraceae bacterium]MBD5509975.1 peptidylprolyl isomerase [Lachnospiraceae bacterium]
MAENNEKKPAGVQEMLDSVNAAIMAIAVGGQSYKIGSRSLTRADLKQLYHIKNDLTAQLMTEKSGSLFDDCYVGVFSGR